MVLFLGSARGSGVLNQYVAAISGSMCYTIMGAATAWPSPTLTKMAAKETPLVLDTSQISWMVSLMFLGHISSPVPSGYLMDRLGRKGTCLSLSILPFASWILILFATSPAHLYIARFAAGLWIGVTTTVMPLYVGEIAEPSLRSSLTTISNLLLNFGVLFAYIIGPHVSYQAFALACQSLVVVYFCMFLWMPESPHFYVKREQRGKAFEALSWLRKGDSDEEIEKEITRIADTLEAQRLEKGSLKDIFCNDGNRKALIIAVVYSILKRMSGSGVLQAYASITLPPTTMGTLEPDSCVIMLGAISLLSSVASTFLAVRYRRRTLMTVSCSGCAISTAVIMVWFLQNAYPPTEGATYSDVIFFSLAIYYATFNVGIGPIGTSIKGEMFSPNMKALCSSITTIVVAFSAFLVNKMYLVAAEEVGMYVNYLVFSVSCVLAVLFTWTYVPDTHNKTLEEIQEILRGSFKYKNYSSTSVLYSTGTDCRHCPSSNGSATTHSNSDHKLST